MIKKTFFIILLVIITISNIDSKVFAQNCSGTPDDEQGCTNGGDLRNGCNWICNNAPPDITLAPIPCCEILAQTGDPFACCFDARRRCTPNQCSSIPDGVAKQRCGQLWEGGNCNEPQPTSLPTNIIQPTIPVQKPTTEPTTIIRVLPNEIPVPVITNSFQNPRPTSVIQQSEFPSIQFPKITFPKININLIELNQNTRKPLDFFEYLFRRITYYDRLLENTLNNRLKNVLTK